MTPLGMIVPAKNRDDCCRLMRALGRDNAPDPGQTFSVSMSPSRTPNATDYGASTYDDELLAILEAGTLPSGIDWSAFGLTAAKADAALRAVKFRAAAGTALDNFAALETREGTGRIPD